MLHTILFYMVALLTGVSAVGVVVTQNIVRACTWLLFSLAGVAGIYFLLGADFVGATQLLVYVGGTLVLVVFGVMLTAQGPFINMKTSAVEWVTSMMVGLLLYAVLAISLLIKPLPAAEVQLGEEITPTTQIGISLLGGQPSDQTGYLLPFEIVSVHLLVVLVGAAYLARTKRRKGAST